MKKNVFFGLLVLILAFCFIGCDTDNINSNTDLSLNGTWVGIVGGIWSSGCSDFCEHIPSCAGFFGWEGGYTFNNGRWEFFEDAGINSLNMKGTYTTSSGEIIMTITHYMGTYFEFSSKFYSRNDLETAFKSSGEFTNQTIAMLLSNYFTTLTYDYAVNGNTLTFISESGSELILQKK